MAGVKTDVERLYPHPDDWVNGSTTVDTKSGSATGGNPGDELIGPQGALVRTYLLELSVWNPTATVHTITLYDGATEVRKIPAPAKTACNLNVYLKGSTNSAWNVEIDAEPSASVYVAASGFVAA